MVMTMTIAIVSSEGRRKENSLTPSRVAETIASQVDAGGLAKKGSSGDE